MEPGQGRRRVSVRVRVKHNDLGTGMWEGVMRIATSEDALSIATCETVVFGGKIVLVVFGLSRGTSRCLERLEEGYNSSLTK